MARKDRHTRIGQARQADATTVTIYDWSTRLLTASAMLIICRYRATAYTKAIALVRTRSLENGP